MPGLNRVHSRVTSIIRQGLLPRWTRFVAPASPNSIHHLLTIIRKLVINHMLMFSFLYILPVDQRAKFDSCRADVTNSYFIETTGITRLGHPKPSIEGKSWESPPLHYRPSQLQSLPWATEPWLMLATLELRVLQLVLKSDGYICQIGGGKKRGQHRSDDWRNARKRKGTTISGWVEIHSFRSAQ